MTTKLKIFGAANEGNVGDDLIALILKKYLEKHLPGVEVGFIPQQQQNELVFDADALVIGGGGLIYDYDYNNVTNYTDVIHLAHSIRLPVYMMGMGVQHVFSQEAIEAYRHAIKLVKRIGTRGEQDSQFIIDKLQYDPERIVTSRDLVFLYDDVIGQPKHVTNSYDKPVVTIALADWRLGDKNYKKIDESLADDYNAYRTYLKEVLPRIKEQLHFKVVCQAKEDIEFSHELVALTGGELIEFTGIEDSARLIDVFRESDFVVTSRYHGLIAAIIAHRPVVSVAFAGHKQQKLINESFPSLKEQFYDVGRFAREDIFTRLTKSDFRNSLQTITNAEYEACLASARKHHELVQYIAGELAKIEREGVVWHG